jgi:chromosome segregation ATPase
MYLCQRGQAPIRMTMFVDQLDGGRISTSMERGALDRELEELTEKLSALRADAAEAEASSTALTEELQEAQGRLVLARRAIEDHEALLARKRDQLRDAEREEARQSREEAAGRFAESISQVLIDLEAYEAAEEALSALERSTPRTSEENDVLAEPWARLKEAVRQRSDSEFADEVVEAAVRSRMPGAINALPVHLQEAARARIQARRREREERNR